MKIFIIQTVFFLPLFSCAQAGEVKILPQTEVEQKDTLEKEISLLFLGDIMGHEPQITAAYDSKTDSYSYDTVFHYMKPIFQSVDYTIANLEVTLGTKPYSGYPQFSSPEALAVSMKNAGINVVMTANNHSCDRRKKGVEKTIDVLDELGLPHTGTYKDQQNKDTNTPLIIEKNGIRVGILNFTYGTNYIDPTPPNIVDYLDSTTILEAVNKAKTKQLDQLIAFVHWGEEYKDIQSKEQEKWNAYLNSLGVNIVIGSHPHVVQPMHWTKDTVKQTEQLVVYSMGNFVSNQRAHRKDGGAMLALRLKKENGKTAIQSANYILTWVYIPTSPKGKDYLVLPASSYMDNPSFFTNVSDYNQLVKYVTHAKGLFEEKNTNIFEK